MNQLAFESVVTILLAISGVHCQDYNATANLLSNLLTNYDPAVRPLLDQSKAVHVDTTLFLAAIKNVDERLQTISVRIYMYNGWQDELLVWTPNDHGNITVLNPLISQVWIPSLNLAGAIDDQQLLVDTSFITPLSVNHTGYVTWFPNVLLDQMCTMDMTKFPYDEHTCEFNIYSVMYYDYQVKVLPTASESDLSQYSENSEFELLRTNINQGSVMTGTAGPFSFIQLQLTIRRRPRFFLFNLLFPTIFLSFLNILVFILPADSGEKVGYSITVLLSVMLFMGSTTSVMPESSKVVPLITQFLTALTVISVLSVMATVAILFIHHKQEQNECKKRKERSALSFIGKLKQKVAARKKAKTVGPTNPKKPVPTDNDKWAHRGPMSTPVSEPSTEADINNKSPRNSITSPNNQLAMVELMKNKKQCLTSNPTDGSTTIYSPSVFQGTDAAFISMANGGENQIFKKRPGVGGIASLWFRGNQNSQDGDKQTTQSTGNNCPEEKSSTSSGLFKRLSSCLDYFFFWIFLISWLSVTVGYMAALFS